MRGRLLDAHQARRDRAAIGEHVARAALPATAAVTCRGELEVVAQRLEQRRTAGHVDLANGSVDVQAVLHLSQGYRQRPMAEVVSLTVDEHRYARNTPTRADIQNTYN